jgi:hypothetical protein
LFADERSQERRMAGKHKTYRYGFGWGISALAGEYSRSRSHRIDASLVVASLLAVLREAFDIGGQVTHKGVWGMSWHQEALKGVEDCEKLRVAVKRAMILGYPN